MFTYKKVFRQKLLQQIKIAPTTAQMVLELIKGPLDELRDRGRARLGVDCASISVNIVYQKVGFIYISIE